MGDGRKAIPGTSDATPVVHVQVGIGAINAHLGIGGKLTAKGDEVKCWTPSRDGDGTVDTTYLGAEECAQLAHAFDVIARGLKTSKGGTTMRATGEKPDPVDGESRMAGRRPDDEHHEGDAVGEGPARAVDYEANASAKVGPSPGHVSAEVTGERCTWHKTMPVQCRRPKHDEGEHCDFSPGEYPRRERAIPTVQCATEVSDAWKDCVDRPLPEDPEIEAAFPTRSGEHELYADAMRYVSARYSKGGLVALVHWLLLENKKTGAALIESLKIAGGLLQEKEKLRLIVDAAMAMYAACPADPDATLKYEAAVDAFVDALAAAGLRMPASLPSSCDPKEDP